jgi:hypothetical protein
VEQFWRVPFVATLLLASVSIWRTRLGRCTQRNTTFPWAQPARSILTRGQLVRASHGEWRHQRRRSVAICELRADTRGHSESRPVHWFTDQRIEKTGASANPKVQAKQRALKELFAALPESPRRPTVNRCHGEVNRRQRSAERSLEGTAAANVPGAPAGSRILAAG